VLGFTGVKPSDVASRATNVLNGTFGNLNYSTPPVDQATFKSAIDALNAGIALAEDGSKKDIVAMHKQMEAVIKMYRQLATYVEANCKDDMATFTSSGFLPLTFSKGATQPLAIPSVKKIAQGSSGQLLVRVSSVAKAKSYELRYGVVANGTTATWTIVPVPSIKMAVSLAGLTPGTIYAFQARALGQLGLTDWSDSATRMCI
jgi:hypothetical protein